MSEDVIRPVLVRNDTTGETTIVLDGQELGIIRLVRAGKNRGRFEWRSILALAPREGVASTEAEALAHIGFKGGRKNA